MQYGHLRQLTDCFVRVFPQLNQLNIPSASPDTVPEWDSLAHITLLSVVGETFGIEIDFEEFEEAASFATILELVNKKTSDAQSQ